MNPFRDPERLQKLASALQSIVIALAVVIGGIWTLYVFNAQLQVENAKAQFAKLSRDLAEQAILEVQVTAQVIGGTPGGKNASGSVNILNRGNRIAVIDLADDALQIARVVAQPAGGIGFDKPSVLALRPSLDGTALGQLTVFPSSQKTVAFLAPGLAPGLYMIQFRVDKPAPERDLTVSLGVKADHLNVVEASTFLHID